MSINSRIKAIRKDKGWNQCYLASLLGVTQPGISYMEREGSTVSDQTIKSLCLAIPGLNEDWLRHGTGSMYITVPTFNLDEFVKERGGTELELEIMRAYFSLSIEVRQAVLNAMKRVFSNHMDPTPTADPEQTIEQLEAEYKKMLSGLAPSKDSSASNIIDDSSSTARTHEG